MSDPVLVPIDGEDFTKVATAVKTGQVHIMDTGPHYIHTYRDTGEDAPTYPDDLGECIAMNETSIPISSSTSIDVYFATAKDDGGGRVRVDL